MFSKRRRPLSELEQQIMDYVWNHPACSAEECRLALAPSRALKESTVRTLLRRLEEKGYVTHQLDGRTYLYRAADRPENVAMEAVRGIVERFCGGSFEQLIAGMVDHEVIQAGELEDLARRIAARKLAAAKKEGNH